MDHSIITETGTDIDKAKQLLQLGRLVAIPTETVYGLAANALNPDAVVKIFEAKDRPFFDPLIVHSYSVTAVLSFVEDFDERLLKLAEKFWPGPLTLLLPKKNTVPDITTSGLERVGVRIPAHALTLSLLKSLPFPLAAPSANPFGYVSPTNALHVYNQLNGKLGYILNGGPCEVGLESTIVGIENNKVCIYRLGGLSMEDIEKEAGKVSLKISSGDDPKAPGMLSSHYAPQKKIIIGDIEKEMLKHPGKKIGVISFFKDYTHHSNVSNNIILSPDAKTNEAAKNLFAAIRSIDDSNAEIIISEYLPEEGLGRAINDRLRRASLKINE